MPRSAAEPLTGKEPALLLSFMAALGVAEGDAAGALMDYARGAMRAAQESGSRKGSRDEARAFQRVVWVSNRVFGDLRAAYLLPWKRAFPGVTDAQLAVARRDAARQIFADRCAEVAGATEAGTLPLSDAEAMGGLAELGRDLGLAAPAVAEVVAAAAQRRCEALADEAAALNKVRGAGRDVGAVVAKLDECLAVAGHVAALAADDDLFPGAAAPTPLAEDEGSVFRREARVRDLRDLFSTWLEARLGEGAAWTEADDAKARALREQLGLSARETDATLADARVAAYKDLLREELSSGRLKAAADPAAALEGLCDRLGFDTEAALKVNEGLWRTRLEQIVNGDGSAAAAAAAAPKAVSEAEDAELRDLAAMFCVGDDFVASAERAVKGARYLRVVDDAFAAGADGFGQPEVDQVARARADLRLSRALALELLVEAGRATLLKFVTASRVHAARVDQAKELKRMIAFSDVVLAPLVDDAKGREAVLAERTKAAEAARAQREIQTMMGEMQAKLAEQQRRAEAEGKTLDEVQKEDDEREDAEKKGREERAAAGTSTPEDQAFAAAEAAKEAEEKRTRERELADAVAASQGQTAITLGDAGAAAGGRLDERDRVDIYRNFLMYAMTGDVVRGPMGVVMSVERDEKDFERLERLGKLLALPPASVAAVHRDLAEEAFKAQAEGIVGAAGPGGLDDARRGKIEELRRELQLDREAADRVVKSLVAKRAAGNLEAFAGAGGGGVTLAAVREALGGGLAVEDVVREPAARMRLFTNEVERCLRSGEGAGPPPGLAAELGVDAGRAAKAVAAAAADRRRLALVQAVSGLRTDDAGEVVRSLHNVAACEAADPRGAVEWREPQEVRDLFAVYASDAGAAAGAAAAGSTLRDAVGAVLGLSEEERADLAASGPSRKVGGKDEGGAKAFF